MFCPSCGKQNPNNVLFCTSCGKAMSLKNPAPPPAPQLVRQAAPSPKKISGPKMRVSFTAVKAVITVVLIAGLVVSILWIYYPSIFH
jgi:uncharacterized membrane protein YvbJ